MEKWEQEPNELKWKYVGLKCWIRRMPNALHLCGYVGVPKAHSLFKVEYDNIPADVHGGLTFSDQFNDGGKLWWIGFDCAHLNDMQPGYLRRKYGSCLAEGTYRDMNYVKSETEKLALQIVAINEKESPCAPMPPK